MCPWVHSGLQWCTPKRSSSDLLIELCEQSKSSWTTLALSTMPMVFLYPLWMTSSMPYVEPRIYMRIYVDTWRYLIVFSGTMEFCNSMQSNSHIWIIENNCSGKSTTNNGTTENLQLKLRTGQAFLPNCDDGTEFVLMCHCIIQSRLASQVLCNPKTIYCRVHCN